MFVIESEMSGTRFIEWQGENDDVILYRRYMNDNLYRVW